MLDFINTFDSQILLWVEQYVRSPFLSFIFVSLTTAGNAGMIFILLGLVLLFFKKTRKIGLLLLISIVVSYIINDLIIKNIVRRERPFLSIEELSALVAHPKSYSFPSGHTASAFSAMTSLFFTKKKYAPIGLIFAFLMGFSRIYVGVHYPSDVLVGAIVGTLSAFICGYIYNKIRVYNYEKK